MSYDRILKGIFEPMKEHKLGEENCIMRKIIA
jgi:hypothetical protein